VRFQHVFPCSHGARNGNGKTAARGHLRKTAVAQIAAVEIAWRATTPVVRDYVADLRIVDHPKRVATEAVCLRVDNGEHAVRRNRRVDSIAARAQDFCSGCGC
jgi:hypothetical protein